MAAILNIINANNRRREKQRVYRQRVHPLETYDDDEIRRRYRLTRELINDLHTLIEVDLEHPTRRSHAVAPIDQICCALRFYATGSFQAVVGDSLGLHRTTVSRIISRVTDAICRLKDRFIAFPLTRDAQQVTKEKFYDMKEFPNILGAIDGTHIFISTPTKDEHLYVSRKGGHSINVLAVCNASLHFTYVLARYPGSTNDAYAWANSRLCQMFENGEIDDGWLIGDNG